MTITHDGNGNNIFPWAEVCRWQSLKISNSSDVCAWISPRRAIWDGEQSMNGLRHLQSCKDGYHSARYSSQGSGLGLKICLGPGCFVVRSGEWLKPSSPTCSSCPRYSLDQWQRLPT